jgi:hypothetical protein
MVEHPGGMLIFSCKNPSAAMMTRGDTAAISGKWWI